MSIHPDITVTSQSFDNDPIDYLELASFDEILDKIESIKEKITDEEYLQLMNNLGRLQADMSELTSYANGLANHINKHDKIIELDIYKQEEQGSRIFNHSASHRVRIKPEDSRIKLEIHSTGDTVLKTLF